MRVHVCMHACVLWVWACVHACVHACVCLSYAASRSSHGSIVHRQHLYGENSIDVKVKSYSRLFVEEVRCCDWYSGWLH